MGKKIVLDRDELYNKYCVQKMSQRKIASYFGVSVDTVQRNLRVYEFPTNRHVDYIEEKIEFSKKQYDYIHGAMLGDGSLTVSKNGINENLSYTTKSFQHCEFVAEPFSDILIGNGIKYTQYFDKRTNKTYFRYTFRTKTNIAFTEEYNKWYKNGIKHIPESLVINPTVCLIWYIGDGGLIRNRNKIGESIKLSTNCFSKQEQEDILLPQLSCFSPKIYANGKNKQGNQMYFIYIPHYKAKLFLDYIGECPFDDYMYKWECQEYKNYSYKNDPKLIDEMIRLFSFGCSAGRIAKIIGVDRTTVAKYLLLNGFDPKDNYFKRGCL